VRPLFVYGTLRHRPLLEALARDIGPARAEDAALPGHRVLRQRDAPWPALVPAPGAEAPGTLWHGLPAAARAHLDLFEVPFGYIPRPARIRTAEGETEADVYFPPEGLPVSDTPWSLDAWAGEEGPLVLGIAREIAAQDPPLDGDALRRQWPMIAHRAAAALRAAHAPPATIRHAAAPGDFALRPLRPPEGRFFRLGGFDAAHRRFDGGRNEGLMREVFSGADAALVLPYDAARDRVLLVEQWRAGPARRGDPQPWTLEPVAGLVDAGETPEQAAIRETQEEAGLAVADLRPMFAGYASPGNATDHFFAFLALCDLPDGLATSGGLEEEHEDLRLHVLPFDRAIALVETGEANAVPLIAMLLWLDRWRRSR
jgi:ADP-ribose pyrophosphatase